MLDPTPDPIKQACLCLDQQGKPTGVCSTTDPNTDCVLCLKRSQPLSADQT